MIRNCRYAPERPSWRFGAAVVVLSTLAGCSGPQQPVPPPVPAPPPPPAPEASPLDLPAPVEPPAPADDVALVETPLGDTAAACRACEDTAEADPLHRWIRAFPLRRGGVVMVFDGQRAEQMEIEMVLEMAGIVGYEDHACGTAVVVWVPGLDCGGDATALSGRIEDETSMTLRETQCFLLDATRMRIRQQCAQGSLPPDQCSPKTD